MPHTNQTPCSLVRRLAAIFYDCILLVTVLFIGTFIAVVATGGVAIESDNIMYKLYLLMLSYAYFCWHWIRGGQTLGMRSWQVFVINDVGARPNWKQASLRFFSALLSLLLCGLGFAWALFDKDKRALHDTLSKTKLILK